MYRKGKWTKKDVKPESGFIKNNEGKDGYGRGNCERKQCHNCGKIGHLVRTCWAIGSEYSVGGRGGRSGRGGRGGRGVRGGRGGRNTNANNVSFPGVDELAIRNPPRPGEPRERTLSDDTEVKWCGLCSSWGDHYRA